MTRVCFELRVQSTKGHRGSGSFRHNKTRQALFDRYECDSRRVYIYTHIQTLNGKVVYGVLLYFQSISFFYDD